MAAEQPQAMPPQPEVRHRQDDPGRDDPQLTQDEVIQIVDLMIERVTTQMAAQGMGLEITPAAKVFLGERGYDPTLGARPLRRAIQRLVEDPLSERLLWKEFRAGQTIVVDVEPDPENEGQSHAVFRAVEGFTPPPIEELATTAD